MKITTTLTRTDCERDNQKVLCLNATLMGVGRRFCKRGNWVTLEIDNQKFIGRSLGRVVCEGVIYIELAQASIYFSSVHIRWVRPEEVREVRPTAPKRVLNFLSVDNNTWCDNVQKLYQEIEYGVSDIHDQLNATVEK